MSMHITKGSSHKFAVIKKRREHTSWWWSSCHHISQINKKNVHKIIIMLLKYTNDIKYKIHTNFFIFDLQEYNFVMSYTTLGVGGG